MGMQEMLEELTSDSRVAYGLSKYELGITASIEIDGNLEYKRRDFKNIREALAFIYTVYKGELGGDK